MAGEASPNTYWNMGNTAVFFHNEKLVERVDNLVRGEPILEDAVVMTANEKLGNYGLRQQSLPQGELVNLGGYVGRGISTYEPYNEGMATVKKKLEVDEDTLDLQGEGWLMNTAIPDMREGLKQASALQLIEGDGSSPKSFDGLKVRRSYSDNEGGDGYKPENPDPTTAAQYGVYHAGGTTYSTRIYAVQWGKKKASVITPEMGDGMGLYESPLKDVEENDANDTTKSRTIYRKYFRRRFGFNLADERALGCIIGIPTALSSIATAAIIEQHLYRMLNEWFKGPETIWLYVSPRVETILMLMMNNKQNVWLSRDNPYRMDIPSWGGRYPIRRCEAISETETANAAV
jgi:hypothetical protein